jgi:hypothetical protein
MTGYVAQLLTIEPQYSVGTLSTSFLSFSLFYFCGGAIVALLLVPLPHPLLRITTD